MESVEKTLSSANEPIELQELNFLENVISDEDIFPRFYEAVATGDLTSVGNILMHFPECINKVDDNHDSALHIAARRGHLPMFKLLLSQENLYLRRNRNEDNALDVAIATNQVSIALHISSHPRWREFLHERQIGTHLTQLQEMVIKMPIVAESFLDRCVEHLGDKKSGEKYAIKYDLSLLYDMPRSFDMDSIRKLSDTLKTMIDEECISCLTHPVCIAYMKNKWHRVGFWMFHINLLFYLVFLVCLTLLSILLEHRSPVIVIYVRVLRYTVLLLCFVQLAKELIQMLHLKVRYFKEFENWLELLLYTISSSCMIIYGNNEQSQRTTHELRGTMAFSIFLAWTVLILYIRSSMIFGTYIIIMMTIVATLVKVVLLMLPFMCAFGIPFFIIFSIPEFPPCEKQSNSTNESCVHYATEESKYLFDNLPLSLWTTFMLLLGEMKYPHTLYKYQPLPFPYATYSVYLIFVLCMPIIIKNLMIGLSVGDVKRIQESAKHKHFTWQVYTIFDIDKTLPIFAHRWLYETHVTEYPLRTISLTRKVSDTGFLDIRTLSLSRKRNSEAAERKRNKLEEIESTIDKLTETMNSQENKINDILEVLKDIQSTMKSQREYNSKL